MGSEFMRAYDIKKIRGKLATPGVVLTPDEAMALRIHICQQYSSAIFTTEDYAELTVAPDGTPISQEGLEWVQGIMKPSMERLTELGLTLHNIS